MKKTLFALLVFTMYFAPSYSQTIMRIHKSSGAVLECNVNEIDSVTFIEKHTEDNEQIENDGFPAKGNGTLESPYNVSAVIKYCQSLEADTQSPNEVYIEGIVCDAPRIYAGTYGNADFKISDNITDNNTFNVFHTLDFDGVKFTDANKVKKGDKVVIVGYVVNYKGNTPETVGNKSHIYSINGRTSGNSSSDDDIPALNNVNISTSGTIVTISNSSVTTGSESISVDLNMLGFENAQEVTHISLTDGTFITLDKGTNVNAPKYYDVTQGIRVYANNTITFYGKSPIANIVMECDSYNGTNYVGNATATVSVSGNQLVYTNASDIAGVQLRVKKITITYAK